MEQLEPYLTPPAIAKLLRVPREVGCVLRGAQREG